MGILHPYGLRPEPEIGLTLSRKMSATLFSYIVSSHASVVHWHSEQICASEGRILRCDGGLRRSPMNLDRIGRVIVGLLAWVGIAAAVMATLVVNNPTWVPALTVFVEDHLTAVYQISVGLPGAWMGSYVNSAFTRGEPVRTDERFVLTCLISQTL